MCGLLSFTPGQGGKLAEEYFPKTPLTVPWEVVGALLLWPLFKLLVETEAKVCGAWRNGDRTYG